MIFDSLVGREIFKTFDYSYLGEISKFPGSSTGSEIETPRDGHLDGALCCIALGPPSMQDDAHQTAACFWFRLFASGEERRFPGSSQKDFSKWQITLNSVWVEMDDYRSHDNYGERLGIDKQRDTTIQIILSLALGVFAFLTFCVSRVNKSTYRI